MDIFVPILKVDASRREVYGVMAEETRDRSGEVFDYTSSKPYVQAWSEEIERATAGKSVGNVRGQHGKIAAGKLVSITFDDAAKRIPVVAKIVDNNEWEKVVAGVYTGFSIGGSYVKKWEDGGATRYTAKPSEVSIVDNPCMYGATFQLVKANGAFEYRGFAGAPSSESIGMSKLQRLIAEAAKAVDEYVARNAAARGARFVTKLADSPVEWTDTARQELAKALDNGTRIDVAQPVESSSPRFQTVESVGTHQRVRSGQPFNVEKSDTADAELEKALANPIRIG
jgi:hypothetical protein